MSFLPYPLKEKNIFEEITPISLVIDHNEKIVGYDEITRAKVKKTENPLKGTNLHTFLTIIYPDLDLSQITSTATDFYQQFIPINKRYGNFEIGYNLQKIETKELRILNFIPSIKPTENEEIESEEQASPLAKELFFRLKLAEQELYDYTNYIPAIFFKQRADYSLSRIISGSDFKNFIPFNNLFKNGNIFLSIIHRQDRKKFIEEIERHKNSRKTFTLTYRIQPPKNTLVKYVMDIRTPQFSSDGKLIGYHGILMDITRQTIAEKLLSSNAWSESLSLLTSGLVHDFSNTMGAIQALTEIHSDSIDENSPLHKGMSQIKECAIDAQKIVRKIINLNREAPGEPEYLDINKLIEEYGKLIEIILPRNTKIEIKRSPTPIIIHIDPTRLKQIFLNLALNSRDAFNQKGKISIEIKTLNPGDYALQNADFGKRLINSSGVEICFSDNGTGIAKENLTKVFEPFFTTKNSEKGTGLGLYNAKCFIEDNEGKIGIKSTPSEGTSFYIYFPQVKQEKESP